MGLMYSPKTQKSNPLTQTVTPYHEPNNLPTRKCEKHNHKPATKHPFTTPDSRSCQSCRSSWEGGLECNVRWLHGMGRYMREHTLVDVGKNTTLGDGDVSQKLVQLLIVADGELKMAGDDTGLLVVTSGVTSQLEDFGREVLKDGREVDRSTGTDTLSVVALAEKTVHTTDRERETSLRRTPGSKRVSTSQKTRRFVPEFDLGRLFGK